MEVANGAEPDGPPPVLRGHRARPQASSVRPGRAEGLRLRGVRVHLRRYGPAGRLTEQRRKLLRDEVRDATKRRGVLLIPSFAVERTQELLVDLVGLMEAGEIPNIPIFIDSPLATKASAIFERHAGEIEDGEALRRALKSPWVRFTESVEQSKAIDRIHSFYIVIAASGMCEAGRIRHHLKAWLWRRGSDRAPRRLPGAGHPRAHPAGRRLTGAHHGRGDAGPRPYADARSLFGPCGRA